MAVTTDAREIAAEPTSRELVERGLARRKRNEALFRGIGLGAILIGITLVAVLFGSILAKGIPGFTQATMHLAVTFDPEIINVPEKPVKQADQTEVEFGQEILAWQRRLVFVNWNKVVQDAIAKVVPAAADNARDAVAMVASGERVRLRDMVADNPSLIGQTVRVSLAASADVDVWLKGNIDRSLPQSMQQLSEAQQQWADQLYDSGVMTMDFSTVLFTNVDSRSSPATAGLLGAMVGSIMMMMIVMFCAVPVGVMAAVYLEEFAPKNRLTQLIEVNINNLAAVPSIVFGLLGATLLLGTFGLPRSAPLVGGLVLALLILPVVIIAARAALRAVPPSIRSGALAVGASRMQAVFHHVLPLAFPGMLTGAILGMARALGETAPLLLIGMVAFVAEVPSSTTDEATALPVLIYSWASNAERAWEPMTAAVIVILLALLVTMNVIVVMLRRKFERRW